MAELRVYWIGVMGIAGKGPAYIETYNPNRTIGELIQSMTPSCGERNKRIEIFKHQYHNLNKYNTSDPYWNHSTKLSEYVNYYNGFISDGRHTYMEMVYVVV